MSAQYGNLIDGEWVDGVEVNLNVNPSNTEDTVGEYAVASRDQVVEAADAGRKAFAAWSRTTAQTRAEILWRAGAELLARKVELGTLLARELGKPLVEATGEVFRAAQVVNFFSGEAVRLAGQILPQVRSGVTIEVTREPVGLIGVITPWNFPIAIAAWKIAPALAFGNCVLFKPAELTPGSGWALVEILVRAGVPPGVLGLVMGHGSVIGPAVVNAVDAVSFTGSVSVGRGIAQLAVQRMSRVQLEMGGKNPLVVLDDADVEVAADCAVAGAFHQTGQRCTASSRLIVTERIHDAFVAAIKSRMAVLVVDDALKPGTQLGPVVDERQLNRNLGYVRSGERSGALLTGGRRLTRGTPGYYMSPALFTEVNNDMKIAREEIFGPVAAVIRVRDYDEALATANDTDFGLTAGICTNSLKHSRHFQRNVEAGITMVNLPTAGLDYHVPFGGRKGSSYGPREQGTYAAEFYTIVKTSYVSA